MIVARSSPRPRASKLSKASGSSSSIAAPRASTLSRGVARSRPSAAFGSNTTMRSSCGTPSNPLRACFRIRPPEIIKARVPESSRMN